MYAVGPLWGAERINPFKRMYVIVVQGPLWEDINKTLQATVCDSKYFYAELSYRFRHLWAADWEYSA